jgi:hypothetical protein
MTRLTDTALKAALRKPRSKQVDLIDGTVPGLFVRLGNGDTATWSLRLRVSGEAGTSTRGLKLKGRKYRLTLGTYPAIGIELARARERVSRPSQERRKPRDFARACIDRRWPDRPGLGSSISRGLCALERTAVGSKIRASDAHAHQSEYWERTRRCIEPRAGSQSDSQGAYTPAAPRKRQRARAGRQRGGTHRHRRAATLSVVGNPREPDQARR